MSDTESDLRAALWGAPPDDRTPRPPAEDALDRYDRQFIRKGARFEVPLLNRFALREVAAILAGFARDLDHVSRRSDLEERQVLFDAAHLIYVTQQKILVVKRGTKEI